ncbi:hypothetical protein SNK04_010641 [Fusarium graminearum]
MWTSRDAHIAGTLVGARRGVQVRSMAMDEAATLLAIARGNPSTSGETGVDDLLEELQCLPLAVSQAGAYMRRMSMTAKEYLFRLKQGKSRWEVLKVSDKDRHRRPEVSNSVLETWRISTERIRAENRMSYRILHTIAYVDSQDIPHELIEAAANQCHNDGEDNQEDPEDPGSDTQVSQLGVLKAVARLKEFSFLSLRQTDNGGRSYEMHKLVREALQYGLRIRSLVETAMDRGSGEDHGAAQAETLYSGRALKVVEDLFPSSEPASWARCEQYLTHAIRVGEWAEVSGTETENATLLQRVSYFLYERGRWREKEPVDSRAWGLRRKVLGEKHPDTIRSMANLAATYHAQGRYDEDEEISVKVLELQREVLGEKHPDTISSMADLAATYHKQGRYDEAEGIYREVLDLQRELLGEKHPDTIRSMADLATTYHKQGRYNEAEGIYREVLDLQREVLGEKHPDTIRSMANLAAIYHAQGRYDEAEKLKDKALELRQEVLGEKHPDTISSMANLAATYHKQGRYDEAEGIYREVLDLRRELLGEKHPDTISSMADLAATYYAQGRYDEAEKLKDKALELQQEVLGEKHPDTIRSMANLAATYHTQGRYDEDEEISVKVLDLRQEVLGEKHPDTISSMADLAATYYAQGRYDEAEKLHRTALDLRRHVLGESHPDTIQSMEYLISTQEALQQLPPLTESVQSLTITRADETEAESKTGRRSLWKDLRRTADKLRNSRFSRSQKEP